MEPKIQDFFNSKHIAVVGVSQSNMKFGTVAYRTLKEGGFNVYPVHPTLGVIMGDKCYQDVLHIPEPVEAMFISVKPDKAESIVAALEGSQIKRIWFQRGADFSKAAEKAKDMGIETVTGKCILMYAPPVKGIHAVHRFLVKIFGKL